MEKKVYSTTEAMKIFGVSRTTIMLLINGGVIGGVKEKGKWVIDGQTLEEWKEFQDSRGTKKTEALQKRLDASLKKRTAEQKKKQEEVLKKIREMKK